MQNENKMSEVDKSLGGAYKLALGKVQDLKEINSCAAGLAEKLHCLNRETEEGEPEKIPEHQGIADNLHDALNEMGMVINLINANLTRIAGSIGSMS